MNWDVDDLAAAAEATGLAVTVTTEVETTETQITLALIARWFTPAAEGRPAYPDYLARRLAPAEVAQVRALVERQLAGTLVAWAGTTVFLARRGVADAEG